jgi:hypothetical protein
MITFNHCICEIEQILAWKQITIRKRDHQKELVVLKKEKNVEKTKRKLPKYQRPMKGARKKTFHNAWSTKHCVEQGEALHAQFMLIYFYMPMPIEPHSMGLFLKLCQYNMMQTIVR